MYRYSFSVTPNVLPPDWRDTDKDPVLTAIFTLFTEGVQGRWAVDMTEAQFTEFRKNLLVGGYKLEEVFRIQLPLPQPEPVA